VVVGSNPGTLDGVSEASYYIVKREIKVAKWGTPKKYLKKIRLKVSFHFFIFFRTSKFKKVLFLTFDLMIVFVANKFLKRSKVLIMLIRF
jgi:hypothetical protein